LWLKTLASAEMGLIVVKHIGFSMAAMHCGKKNVGFSMDELSRGEIHWFMHGSNVSRHSITAFHR
jgi:hypothetical protein